MATIGLVWEFGANLGHVTRLARYAQALLERGHRVFAVMPSAAQGHLIDPRVSLFPTPWIATNQSRRPALTYSDLFHGRGYSSHEALRALVLGYQNLFQQLRPDALILDNAPTPVLAARSLSIFTLSAGSGWEIPPPTSPLPAFAYWEPQPKNELCRREEETLTTVRQAMRGALAPDATLEAALRPNTSLLLTYPELDHYKEYRHAHAKATSSGQHAEYVGALFELDRGEEPTWPPGDGPRVFAYLRPSSQHFRPALSALARAKVRAVVFAPQVAPESYPDLPPHVTLTSRPVRLRKLRHDCSLALTHGGASTPAAFLVAGVPVLCFPSQVEHLVMSRRIQDAKLGALLMATPKADYDAALQLLLGSTEVRRNVKRFSEAYAKWSGDWALNRVVERTESGLARQ